ncbi:MAG TPA: GDYXXLXY domain-containing protein [Rubrivivax sp.]|jgi:hypothetical protein|nr:GDYXXLXY domain-containing protein [Rubrivivax sp.]HMR70747.1 GDYXXLXY domain-containing protein [Rubrivivax sp.]
MKLGPASRILAVAAVCAITLIGLVIREGRARDAGAEVRLPIEAVDPRALLSGHYVIVAPTWRLDRAEPCPPGQDGGAWVALAPREGVHVVAGAAATREEAQRLAPLVARGGFMCRPPRQANGDAPVQPGVVRATLGPERFHITQDDAERIDGVLREQRPGAPARAFAVMSIGADGRARLKGLIVDGRRFDLDWF